jgi:DNA-binding CsgD family transcriptional regulator
MPADRRPLTKRERDVLDGIDRRLPLKLVAAELGVSESRVNQHVRALKERYRVNTLPELIEAWRREEPDFVGETTYRNSAWRIPQVPAEGAGGENESRVAPGEFVLADAAPFAIEAPWMTRIEPRVVPGMLDGDNAVLIRPHRRARVRPRGRDRARGDGIALLERGISGPVCRRSRDRIRPRLVSSGGGTQSGVPQCPPPPSAKPKPSATK